MIQKGQEHRLRTLGIRRPRQPISRVTTTALTCPTSTRRSSSIRPGRPANSLPEPKAGPPREVSAGPLSSLAVAIGASRRSRKGRTGIRQSWCVWKLVLHAQYLRLELPKRHPQLIILVRTPHSLLRHPHLLVSQLAKVALPLRERAAVRRQRRLLRSVPTSLSHGLLSGNLHQFVQIGIHVAVIPETLR